MRKSLSTILTVLLLTINAARARADSPSLNTVTFKCADACVTLLAAPDVSFPSPLIEATSRGYDFSSPFASNWTPAKEYVWETGTVSYGSRGTTYDSGDFDPILDQALALADYEGFKKRKRESQKHGKHRGFGICCLLEHSGGAPIESAKLSFPGNDTMLLTLNVQNTGQGHATVFPRVMAATLGIPASKIAHAHGDSSNELAGYASVGSRSAMTAGHSIVKAMDTILEKGKPIAATMLETGEADIVYRTGNFEVVGTDRRVTLFEVATRAAEMKKRGEIAEDLDTKTTTETPLAYPNGVHTAEVEIDPDTGHLTIATYTAVDDCGQALDAMIVQGQLHGSVAAGLGQVLMENVVYDEGNGQLVTGSFMDYAMPRADDIPPMRDALYDVPATTNPLGVKGVGEAGTTAAISAVMNAIADAIPNGAADHMEMPATAQRVWEACQRAKA